MGFFDFLNLNPFSKYFQKNRHKDDFKENQEIRNSQGVSQEEIDFSGMIDYSSLTGPTGGMSTVGIQFEQYFGNKKQRVGKYREMALYPEISEAIDSICDEAIVQGSDGDIVDLEIKEEFPEYIEDEVRKIWKYLVNDVFSFNENAWDLFKKWLIEAELYVELISNNNGDNLVGIKVLPSFTMVPIYEENKIKAYIQVAEPVQPANMTGYYYDQQKYQQIIFDKDQISYINYGLYGANLLDVRGFLEASIRTYNQIRNLEDSLVIYRLVRAPERRVWNIAVGRMPKGKAEEYIKGLITRYKKKIVYDPDTGAMNSAQNVQSLQEDFWFARNENGEGTTVDTIGGGMNLGEIEDVNYFLKKLYKILKFPSSRWQEPGTLLYSGGKMGEIQQEEIKFSRFVERLQNRFKYIILNPFLTILRMRGIDQRYIDEKLYNISFQKSNLFKEYKEMDLLESKFGLLSNIEPYIYKKEENESGFLSREFVLRKYFMMSEEDFNYNEELLSKEKTAQIVGSGDEESSEESSGEEEFGAGGGEEVPEEVPEETPETGSEEEIVKSDVNNKNEKFSLVKAWKTTDNIIKNRYNDNGIIKKFL